MTRSPRFSAFASLFIFCGMSACVSNDADNEIDPCIDADADNFTICDGDCDDSDPTRFPGAEEICDGLDNDCDGMVPYAESPQFEGHVVTSDTDADSFSTCDGDCDDRNRWIYPGADELCNGLDDDCDGEADEDGGDLAIDSDLDGFTGCTGDCDEEFDFVNVESFVVWNLNREAVAELMPPWFHEEDSVWDYPGADTIVRRACDRYATDWPYRYSELLFAPYPSSPTEYIQHCLDIGEGFEMAIASELVTIQFFDPIYDKFWDWEYFTRYDAVPTVQYWYDSGEDMCYLLFTYQVFDQ